MKKEAVFKKVLRRGYEVAVGFIRNLVPDAGKMRLRRMVQEKREELSEDECYAERIKMETPDGTGATTHPYVLYFEKGWKGHKFWMIHTPYENDNVQLEIPYMAVSEDGVNFKRAAGQPELPADLVKEKNPAMYYSDAFLVFRDGKLEVWYRHTIEENGVAENRIYRVVTRDGVKYSEPELVIDNDGGFYLSPSIVKDGKKYLMYYFDDGGMFVRESADLKKWGKRRKVELAGFSGTPWHGEVREMDGEMVLLLMESEGGLYFLKRKGVCEFGECRKMDFIYAPRGTFYSKVGLYKSSIVKVRDIYYIYVPFKVYTMRGVRMWRKWEMTVSKMRDLGRLGL